MANSPFSTPKRKRSEMLNDGMLTVNTTTPFTFDVNSNVDDGNASPRTRVAHRFRGLALGGGGGATEYSADLSTADNDVEDASRKRVKLPDVEMRDVDSSAAADLFAAGVPAIPRRSQPPQQRQKKEGSPSRRRPASKSVYISLDDAVVEQSETIANTGTDDSDNNPTPPSFAPPTPPPSQPQPQPRNRPFKRAGTPPFPTPPPTTAATTTTGKPKPAFSSTKTTTATTITDPLRASLTWHDDEITIYDPDDSDDDGTGINGIGFKPTPAIAYARTVRRRQQLAEYRKREEREARAKRSLRRRGPSPAPGALSLVEAKAAKAKGERERRRVRFLEREGPVAGVVAGELIGV